MQKGTLFLEALLFALGVKIGLMLGSLRQVQRFLDRWFVPSSPCRHGPQPVLWAVEAVGRRVPFLRNCLVQALAARAMLRRRGYRPVLHIGVARDSDQILAHAWLELDGKVILGGPDVSRFRRLETYG